MYAFICVQQCVERVQRAVGFIPPQSWHRCQKNSVISKQTNKQKRESVKKVKDVGGEETTVTKGGIT